MGSTMLVTALALASAGLAIAGKPSLECDSSSIPKPELFGAEVLSLTAVPVTDYTDWAAFRVEVLVETENQPISFCNVTITHTHPGWNDEITTHLGLPLSPAWNGRFMGTGGGGWATGVPNGQAGPVSLGYAAASTDGGRNLYNIDEDGYVTAEGWSLSSPGNPNWPLIQDFLSVSLDDMAKLGKAITTSFYGTEPEYSYWNGCSTGGRQGLMHAQRFPENYDGILADAPAINWADFVIGEFWPVQVMHQLNYYPPPCELEYYNNAATEACDDLDGLTDGIISAPRLCNFNPHILVGQEISCTNPKAPNTSTPFTLTSGGASVVLATWDGMVNPPNTSTNPTASPKKEWYGLAPGSPFRLANTVCTPPSNPHNCTPTPFPISEEFIRLYLAQDPAFNTTTISNTDYFALLHYARNQWDTIFSTRDADLSRFKHHGGKMITFHGMADQLIPVSGSADYYSRVQQLDPHADQYYRYFEAPGATHCRAGPGSAVFPSGAFGQLVDWVERGTVPEWLVGGVWVDGSVTEEERKICPWPFVAVLRDEGLAGSVEGWECVEGFGFDGVGGRQTVLGEVGRGEFGVFVD